MTRNYRIRRVEDADEAIDMKAVLKSVLGLEPQEPAARPPQGSICFAAIADQGMVGSIRLHKPDAASGYGVARVEKVEVEAGHERLGCREALLDVALQWARANEYSALTAAVPAASPALAEFYAANGFDVVGSQPGPDIALAIRLADARPHSDAWYSKHHGAWFASIASRA